MQSLWILALAASGCRAVLGIEGPPVPPDGGHGDPLACASWHPEGFDPCAIGVTMPALVLGDGPYVYDTAASAGGTLYDAAHHVVVQSEQMLLVSGDAPVAVLSVDQLTTSAATRLSVIGPRPLLIVSWSSIVLDGVIDAGSHLGIMDAAAHTAKIVQFGAGANQGCLANAGRDGGDAMTGGSGGGGGGGLQATGGSGGTGGPGGVVAGAGGDAMTAAFHGGCPGGTSGAAGSFAQPPASAGSRALGGAGGGAIRLVAHDAIDARGSISANGAGGAGAPTNSACGGGGGGSGGYIGFEAPMVTLAGSITANGGGGGGGGSVGSVTTGITGNDGEDGVVSAQPAPGGAVATGGCGQAGGAGAAALDLGGSAATGAGVCKGGGGGGGGASGFIVIKAASYTPGSATLSPAAQRL